MLNRLQYISQGETEHEQLNNISNALDGGCGWIQLRFKTADENTFLKTAQQVMSYKKKYKFTFIINDYPLVAKKIDADGVHLGLEDMDIMEARNIVGDERIIGGTANTIQQVIQRLATGVDYIGLGPYRFTTTKAKLSPVLGLGGYQGILQVLQNNKSRIPVYAIGGLELADLSNLMKTGIHGIGVSSMITNAPDKKQVIQSINNILNGKTHYSGEAI